MSRFEKQREFLKTDFKVLKGIQTDAAKGIAAPAAEKPVPEDALVIPLPEVDEDVLIQKNILTCLKNRRSVRNYSEKPFSMQELSYLLWACGGISGKNAGGKLLRTVPSAGMSYTVENYLLIRNVEGLDQGLYRYQFSTHSLVLLKKLEDITTTMDELTMATTQPFLPYFAGKSNIIFIWSALPYRAEWKFDIQAHKKILIDVGHICQNLYLASESIDAGCCAIGIYDQEKVDDFLEMDAEEEMVLYLAAVGKKLS